MKAINPQKFLTAIHDVIVWNATANNGLHDFTPAGIEAQYKYTREEIRETIVAAIDHNTIECLDGAADVFVTLGYKIFKVTESAGLWEESKTKFLEWFSLVDLEDVYGQSIEYPSNRLFFQNVLVETNCIKLYNEIDLLDNNQGLTGKDALIMLYEFMSFIQNGFDVNALELLEVVSESNWSKYPPVSDFVDQEALEQEERWIEAERGKNDVKAVVSPNGMFYIFRDKGGVGKICKPSTFVEPDISSVYEVDVELS